jgi:putative DNA primase/helicase
VALASRPPPAERPPVRCRSVGALARYVARAVEEECAGVAAATKGRRNFALFIASAKLGELVGAGALPENILSGSLEAAAADCGLVAEDGWRQVRATIASGLARGMRRPRELSL